jgi:hypothetical protein
MPTILSTMPDADFLRLNRHTMPRELEARFESCVEEADRAQTLQERVWNLESRLDFIADAITTSNWRTGKKDELRSLIETIESQTDYNEDPALKG